MFQIEGKFARIIVLLAFCLILGGLFTAIGTLLVEPIFGKSVLGIYSETESEENVLIIKFLQLISSLGLFVAPAILFSILFMSPPIKNLKLNKGLNPSTFLLIILLFFSFLPLINWIVELNNQMQLPDFLSEVEAWMKASEAKAKELTETFLRMEGEVDLFYNILLIGVIPAIGEELIFRGILQRTINQGSKNYHLGIWISAILFSAMHLQFYGFLPRMLLGAFFGYLMVWSGSLWVPIFAHFLNNTTAVVVVYFLGTEAMEQELDKIGTTDNTYILSIFSLLIFGSLMWYFKKNKGEIRLN